MPSSCIYLLRENAKSHRFFIIQSMTRINFWILKLNRVKIKHLIYVRYVVSGDLAKNWGSVKVFWVQLIDKVRTSIAMISSDLEKSVWPHYLNYHDYNRVYILIFWDIFRNAVETTESKDKFAFENGKQ